MSKLKTLKHFIARKNDINTLFGHDEITFPLTQNDVDYLFRSLDCEMSPEHLHMDGEATPSEARQREQYLKDATDQLRWYCEAGGTYTEPTDLYCI